MTRVVAPSRLHFGLVNAGTVPGAPLFGGCGLMIDSPGVAVRVEPAREWVGIGPSSDRAVGFAKSVTAECHRITVERCPPEHVGLGVGTALGLAVAKALRPTATAAELAKLTRRGLRSGVGLHGFDQGGFIVDGGKRSPGELPELGRRLSFPADWRVVLARRPQASPWHGHAERAAFDRAGVPDFTSHHEAMIRALSWIEGLVEKADDFNEFAYAIHYFNREAGKWFEATQGGLYAGPGVTELVGRIRRLGFLGVGQSSWGPTVFAFAADPEIADWLAGRLRRDAPELIVGTAAADNGGAVVTAS